MNVLFILPQNTNNNKKKSKTVIQKQIKVARKPKETMGLIDIGLPQSKKIKLTVTVRPGSKAKIQ